MARTPGIDVSRWQGEIAWPVVAAHGYLFAAIRATVGDYYTDPRFNTNWQGASAANLLVTAYHVVRPAIDPAQQITRLFDALDGRTGDLPLVLDVEKSDDQSPAAITQTVLECARLIEERARRKPIIYTTKWFWDPQVLRRNNWRSYDLWIADYEAPSPTLPVDWPAWRLWQYSEVGSVPGVASPADLNWFNGSADALAAYCDVS